MSAGGIILIVEDSEPCVTALELALFGLEHLETRSARTGAQALAILGQTPVRAVVTDLQLPPHLGREMDGFDLIRQIRDNIALSSVPILVTSGDSDPGNSERLRHLGVDAYFVKPYSPAAFRRTLEQLLHV